MELCLQFANIMGILSSLFLRFGCNIYMKIFFYLPVNSEKPKFVAVLVFVSCTIAPFIENVSKRDAILAPVAKQWIAKDIPSYAQSDQNAPKLLFTDLENLLITDKLEVDGVLILRYLSCILRSSFLSMVMFYYILLLLNKYEQRNI